MKNITDIFEGVFNNAVGKLTWQTIIDNPDSEFNTLWVPQFMHTARRDQVNFEYRKQVLIVSTSNIKINFLMNPGCKPLSDFISDIKTLSFVDSTTIDGAGNNITGQQLAPEISFNTRPIIRNVDWLGDMRINLTRPDEITFWGVTGIKNSTLSNVDQLDICNKSTIIENIEALKLHTIKYDGRSVFDDFSKLNDIIDWKNVNFDNDPNLIQYCVDSKYSLKKIANYIKKSKLISKYDQIFLPLAVEFKIIVNFLYRNCNFPLLENIKIYDGSTTLIISKNGCTWQKGRA